MSKRKAENSRREDALRNEALVRKALVAFLKKHQRPPTVQELATITGLSDKTVRAHRQRLRLGDGSPNVFQQLTGDVLMALYERATGYEHAAVKILAVSKGKGMPSVVEQVAYTERYPPDPTAAKLWMQLVEGFTERSEKKHSGDVGVTMKFNYVAPAGPAQEGGSGGN